MIQEISEQVPFWVPANELLGLDIKENLIPYNIQCPFHSDDTPSMRVHKDGLAYCFGCGRMYSSYDCILLYTGSKKEAIKLAKEQYNVVFKTREQIEQDIKISEKNMRELIKRVNQKIEDGKDEYAIMRFVHRQLT